MKVITSVIASLLLSSIALVAQTLTLQESIDKTLLNHPDIKSFQLKIQQSKAGVNRG